MYDSHRAHRIKVPPLHPPANPHSNPTPNPHPHPNPNPKRNRIKVPPLHPPAASVCGTSLDHDGLLDPGLNECFLYHGTMKETVRIADTCQAITTAP